MAALDFSEHGVALYPAFLDTEEIELLKKATDEAVEARRPPFQQDGIRELTWHPRVLAEIDKLVASAA